MISLSATRDAAYELEHTGTREPSLLLALWAAQLTIQTELARTGKATRALAPYVTTGLPGRDAVAAHLRAAKMPFSGRTLDCLYGAERLAARGVLDAHQRTHGPEPGAPLRVWKAWRANLWAMLHDECPGWASKVVSMAAFIMYPTTSDLAICDRHVCRRLFGDQHWEWYYHRISHGTPAGIRHYQTVESLVCEERNARLGSNSGVPLGIWHWYQWAIYREGRRHATDGVPAHEWEVESHAALSPRWY